MLNTVRDKTKKLEKKVEGDALKTGNNALNDLKNTAVEGAKALTDSIIDSEGPGGDNMGKISDLQRRSRAETTKLDNLLQKLEKKIDLVGQKMARQTQKPIVEATNQRKVLDLTEGIK